MRLRPYIGVKSHTLPFRDTDAEKTQEPGRLYNQQCNRQTYQPTEDPLLRSLFFASTINWYFLINKSVSSAQTLTYILKYPYSYHRSYCTDSTIMATIAPTGLARINTVYRIRMTVFSIKTISCRLFREITALYDESMDDGTEFFEYFITSENSSDLLLSKLEVHCKKPYFRQYSCHAVKSVGSDHKWNASRPETAARIVQDHFLFVLLYSRFCKYIYIWDLAQCQWREVNFFKARAAPDRKASTGRCGATVGGARPPADLEPGNVSPETVRRRTSPKRGGDREVYVRIVSSVRGERLTLLFPVVRSASFRTAAAVGQKVYPDETGRRRYCRKKPQSRTTDGGGGELRRQLIRALRSFRIVGNSFARLRVHGSR